MKTRPGFGLLVVIVVLFTGVVMSFAGPFPIPDTGQTECYDADGNILDPCPAPGDLFYGQDACYTINPPSYTKLDASGNELDDSAIDWAMVRDNITGLIWEVKTDDGGIHDKDDQYTWSDAADVFIAQLNADNFGGYSDWRLPTINELAWLTDLGTYDPSIDTNYFPYFPETTPWYYWSSTTYAYNTDCAWRVDFGSGFDYGNYKSNTYYVRAVRGGQSSNNFTDNGDGTVTDQDTGLMWAKNTADTDEDGDVDSDDRVNWQNALAWCEDLSLAEYDDWRLPTRKELRSLVDYEVYDPSIDTNYFPDTMSASYWSSTTYARTTGSARYVGFYHGAGHSNNKSGTYHVRAVRGGPDTNIPPTADAGEDREIMENILVTLDGSDSYDPDDGIDTYFWEQTGGEPVVLSDPAAVQPTFTVPSGVVGQTLTFALTVTDYSGSSDTDNVVLTATEYACVSIPDQPVLLFPQDEAVNVSLTPTLQTSAYNDPDACSTHLKTRWQISERTGFNGLAYNANTFGENLTSHQVTQKVLKPDTTYYWRVKYWGDHGIKSDWSEVFSFTTESDNRDTTGNGVPDDQEAPTDTDINDNGIFDIDEENLRSLFTAGGNDIIGLEFADDIESIALETISEKEMGHISNIPGDFPYGMMAFRVEVARLGATVSFTAHLQDVAPDTAAWYKYDRANGWYDFTRKVTFSPDRKSVTFQLTDGGPGDATGTVNGVIVDPAGLVIPATGSGSGSGSSCFIDACIFH